MSKENKEKLKHFNEDKFKKLSNALKANLKRRKNSPKTLCKTEVNPSELKI